MLRLLFTIIILFLCGCTASDFSSKTNKADDDEGRRPSESGEGIPGYLTDPELVTIKAEDGRVTAKGEKGAVKAETGAPEDVLVCLETYPEGLGEGNKIEILDRSFANLDGSFQLAGKVGADIPVGINVTGRCDETVPADLFTRTEERTTYIVQRNDEKEFYEVPDGLFDGPPGKECKQDCDEKFALRMTVKKSDGDGEGIALWVVEESLCGMVDWTTLDESTCPGGTKTLSVQCATGDVKAEIKCDVGSDDEKTFATFTCERRCRDDAVFVSDVLLDYEEKASLPPAKYLVLTHDDESIGKSAVLLNDDTELFLEVTQPAPAM